jgi:hypothetical protein
MSGKEELEAFLKSSAGKRSSFLSAFDYLIGDYFLEIRRQLNVASRRLHVSGFKIIGD